MSQHRCATCLKPLAPQRVRAGEILCPDCETRWLQQLAARPLPNAKLGPSPGKAAPACPARPPGLSLPEPKLDQPDNPAFP